MSFAAATSSYQHHQHQQQHEDEQPVYDEEEAMIRSRFAKDAKVSAAAFQTGDGSAPSGWDVNLREKPTAPLGPRIDNDDANNDHDDDARPESSYTEEGTESTSSAASGLEQPSPAIEDGDKKLRAIPSDDQMSPAGPPAHYHQSQDQEQAQIMMMEAGEYPLPEAAPGIKKPPPYAALQEQLAAEESSSPAAVEAPDYNHMDTKPKSEEYLVEEGDEAAQESAPPAADDEGPSPPVPGELVRATLIRDIDESSHGSEDHQNSAAFALPPPTELMRDNTGVVTIQSDLAVVEAKPVEQAPTKTMSRKLICAVMGALLFVIAALSVGFVVSAQKGGDENSNEDSDSNSGQAGAEDGALVGGDNNTSVPVAGDPTSAAAQSLSPTPAFIPVLDRLQQGGVLRCGVVPNPGLFYMEDSPDDGGAAEAHGFDAALCKAIAAAATGDSERVEFVQYAFPDVLPGLKAGEIDVVAAGLTHTMERQVYHAHSQAGFAFTMPYLYQGMQLAGQPTFVECGDKGLEFIAACGEIKVCVVDRSTHQQMLSSFLPGQKLVARDTGVELRDSLANGTCNVIAHEGYTLAEQLVRDAGYKGEYLVGRTLFSKEPLAIATSADDPRFADFANIVLSALIEAEATGVTQSTANSMDGTDAFGAGYSDMLRQAVAAGGNYGELYARYLEPYSKRQGLNLINFGNLTDTGLLYSHPYGSITNEIGQPGATLSAIVERQRLRCGVRPNRPGFAETSPNNSTNAQPWKPFGDVFASGMEADYCRAVAASAFQGNSHMVEYVEIADQEAGFALLASGELDIVAGATWNFLNDIRVPGIDEGFSFTQPYFYGNSTNGLEENLCLATNQGDHLWSSFVYWIVAAVVQAEEAGVDQGMSNGMPNVNLFGVTNELMFQDAILAVGNYDEMYKKHMTGLIPRVGRNLLNGNVGPQLYPIPGLQN